MGFGGILAAGLAGGAKAVGDQLTTDIKNQEDQRIWLERQNALEQAQIRALDYQDKKARERLLFETSPEQEGGKAKLAMAAAAGKQQTDEDVRKATALKEAEIADTKRIANDPAAMAAYRAIKLNDPLVAAQIAQSMAAAGASSAHTALLNENLTATKKLNAVADKVRILQDSLSKAGDDATRNAIQQQITDLGFTGKDVTKFLEAANRMQDNATNALKLASDPGTSEPQRQKLLDEWSQANNAARQLLVSGGVKIKEATDKPKTEAEAQALASAALKAGKDPAAVKALMDRWQYAMPTTSGSAAKKPTSPTSSEADPTQAATDTKVAPAVRIKQIQDQLNADDDLKSGKGFDPELGILGRAWIAGRMPLAVFERMDLERELAKLNGQ